MELAEPSMEGQIIKLAEEGFGHIDIMPLFFAAGRHLRKDVPGQIEALQTTLTEQGLEVTIELHPPVGLEPEVTDALRNIVISRSTQIRPLLNDPLPVIAYMLQRYSAAIHQAADLSADQVIQKLDFLYNFY